MTMHLLGPQFSTLSSRKRKSKDVTINAKFAQEFREYNKLMKKCGCKEKTIDEYIAYRKGKAKTTLRGTPMPQYKSSTHRQQYPSYGDQAGSIPAKPEQKYTGTLIKGIATMHKSNAVPIISDEDAHEVARMRRG